MNNKQETLKQESLNPYAIDTDKGHFVVLQAKSKQHAKERFVNECSEHGNLGSIRKVECQKDNFY